jgi:hypothetical protein
MEPTRKEGNEKQSTVFMGLTIQTGTPLAKSEHPRMKKSVALH